MFLVHIILGFNHNIIVDVLRLLLDIIELDYDKVYLLKEHIILNTINST